MVLKPFELKSFPFTQDGIDYFNKVKPDVFYYSMAIQYVEVIASYKTAIDFKNNYLKKAFSEKMKTLKKSASSNLSEVGDNAVEALIENYTDAFKDEQLKRYLSWIR